MFLKGRESLGHVSVDTIVEFDHHNQYVVAGYFSRLNALQREVQRFVDKHEIDPKDVQDALASGQLPNSPEVARWIIAYETLEAEKEWQAGR